MHDYFRGNPDQKSPLEFLRDREPIRPEYRDREVRLGVMDEHGLEKIWLFPTLGILYEELLKDDIFAVNATFTAFNRWLDEDWGCNFDDRIFAAPYLSLADPEWAIGELEWALEHDARTIVLRPAAPTTIHGQLSPFDEYFDPIWQRINDAGITVVVHAGDSGYSSQGYAKDGFGATFEGAGRASIKMFNIERAAYDFLITAMFDRLFDRFPNVRMASVENGSEFLPDLFKKLASTGRKMPGYFSGDPIEQFREHVWINPFWEDDVTEIVDLMGADRVIFGSDWPHIEGMPRPLDYAAEVKEFDDASQRRIMRDNAMELNERRPV
jgi:predicted TIM-barrel fold metal-dependent hydrolase